MADFALNEDQLQLQKWVHDFAETVIRPAAHEWDEREEFPFPIVQQAAEFGLSCRELVMNSNAHQTGPPLPGAPRTVPLLPPPGPRPPPSTPPPCPPPVSPLLFSPLPSPTTRLPTVAR